MGLQKIKFVTGASLSVLLSLAGGYTAMAQTPGELTPERLIAQVERSEDFRGKVIAVNNEVVTVELPNGDRKKVNVSSLDRTRLGLGIGSDIIVYDDRTVAMVDSTTLNEGESTALEDEVNRVFEEIRRRQEEARRVREEALRRVREERESRTIERRIERRPAPEPVRAAPAVAPAAAPAAAPEPVRALW